MTKLINTDIPCERAVIASIIETEEDVLSFDELAELAVSAGAEVVAKITQKKPPNAYALFGKGKLDEIVSVINETRANLLIVDNSLSGSTMRNLSEIVGVKVIDREGLILDVFALRARSPEGKMQVELAQHKYSLSRLVGVSKNMAKYGGGIGMRGPGEKKLEVDKRILRKEIDALTKRIQKLTFSRELRRQNRKKTGEKTVALVGYTNAGKTTLLNLLAKENKYAQDRLFATLDPITRKVYSGENKSYLLTDTVGFIRRLPHEFISAFSSTLEEAREADLLLIVLDSSAPDVISQYDVVIDTLNKMQVDVTNQITVFNKSDIAPIVPLSIAVNNKVLVSALRGDGIEELKQMINKRLFA